MDEEECSRRIVGAAIEVHRTLGPGLLEFAYREALQYELRSSGLHVVSEKRASVSYKDLKIAGALRLDLLVENLVIVELKAVERLLPVHRAQLLTYLRCCNKQLGLLLNFHESLLKRGIVRVTTRPIPHFA